MALFRFRRLRSGFRKLFDLFLVVRVSLSVTVVLCVLCGVAVWGLAFYSFKIVVGEVRVIGVGVGVYWDSNCDNPVGSLSWGKIVVNPLQPNASKNVTVYIRNEGSSPITLQLNTSDWDPPGIRKYVSLDWDYGRQVLRSNEVLRVTLVLSVDSAVWFEWSRILDYSFNIIIFVT